MTINPIVILTTCASRKEAGKIAHALLAKRLIACANIIPGVESIFRWNGKLDEVKEALLILKTKRARFAAVKKEIGRIHSYEVPEIIALPIASGSKRYLQWIDKSVC
ncbi:MAG: divalent-cation tolerance protein CutA [Candidatus Omnitrophota bacterium]|nr:divalent-cation tolerance protein CutA [Candidatus Omnitrophota bacterium]